MGSKEMDRGHEQFLQHLGDGFPKVFHTSGYNSLFRWMFLAFIPMAVYMFIDGIISGDYSTPRDIVSLGGVSILFGGSGWFLFSMWAPGEIRMDQKDIEFSRWRYLRSTPWSNVKDCRLVRSGIELEMEFVKTPFPWYEFPRWIGMFMLLPGNRILLGRKEWSEGTRNSITVIGKRMSSLYELEEPSSED